MGPFKNPFRGIFRSPFRSPFSLGGIAGLVPPCFTALLSWYRGTVIDAIYLKDSAPALGDYPLQMVDGPCLTMALTDYLTILGMPSDATITYQGTAVAVVDASNERINFTSAGTFYDLRVFTEV